MNTKKIKHLKFNTHANPDAVTDTPLQKLTTAARVQRLVLRFLGLVVWRISSVFRFLILKVFDWMQLTESAFDRWLNQRTKEEQVEFEEAYKQ